MGIENQAAGQLSCAGLFDARGVFSLVADFRKGGDAELVGYAFTVMASVFVWLGVCGDHVDVCPGRMARSQCISQQRYAVEMASVSMVDSGHLGRGGVREVVHV